MNFKKTLSKNSPNILIGMGLVGMAMTAYLAAKATPKAIKNIEDKKKELNKKKLAPSETLKVTWKCYVPAALTFTASTGCIISSSSISSRRNAAAVAAYTIANSSLTEYKDKVKEVIGEKKEAEIQQKIAEDQPAPTLNYVVSDGMQLYRDKVTGVEFTSTNDKIRDAVNDINAIMADEGSASLNQFYEFLGVPPIDLGEELGWVRHRDGKMDVRISDAIVKDGKAYLVLDYYICPRNGYDDYFA